MYPIKAYLILCKVHRCVLQCIYSSASQYSIGPFSQDPYHSDIPFQSGPLPLGYSLSVRTLTTRIFPFSQGPYHSDIPFQSGPLSLGYSDGLVSVLSVQKYVHSFATHPRFLSTCASNALQCVAHIRTK